MTAREETVLPPIDPSISDENDWWEFSLSDVKVLRPGKHLYASLLDATEDNPVQVIGELELSADQEHLVVNPENLSKRLLLDDVTHYAYGQTEDRNVELWVAGKAGWYKIKPAKQYLPTFNRMVQAVDMYYFLMDKHQAGKKHVNPTYKNLCQQYIYHTHGDCETREQSAEKFTEHGSFLLRCMIEDDDDMLWNKTNVFIHLRRQFKELYEEIIRKNDDSEDEEDDDEPQVATPRHDPAAVTKSQTDAVYKTIQELKDEGHLAKRRLNLDLVAERLSESYSFSKENAARIIAARASVVLEKLDEDENSRWSRYVIHRELTHAAAQNESLPTSLLTPLQPLDDSSDDEELARTQKSVLRPKIAAAVSGKLIGKRNRAGPVNQDAQPDGDEVENEEDPDAMSDVETPSKTRGHELIRTPFSSARPRTRSILSKTGPGPAASLLKSMLREPPQTPATIASKETNGISDRDTSIPPLPPIDLDESLETEVWNCRMSGCTTAITSKGDERKKEIEAHAGKHDWDKQMLVEMVETERSKHSFLPVTNLMQYMITQHYQKMRAAFPEIYPVKNEHNKVNDNANGVVEPVNPSLNGESLSSPSVQPPATKSELVDGEAT